MSKKIILDTVDDYKALYIKEFIEDWITTHDWWPVIFKEGHFNHMFFRNKNAKPKFDKKIANDMLLIKDIITGSIDKVEIYEGFNNKQKRKEREYIYIYNWLYIVLMFDKKTGDTLSPITAYHKSKWDIIKFKISMSKNQIL